MTKVTAAIVLLVTLAWAQELYAQGRGPKPESVSARARRWRAEIDGSFRADDLGVAGTSLSIADDMGLDEQADINDIGLSFNAGGVGKINLQYWWGAFEGDTTLTNTANFAGLTYPAGSVVSSQFDWKVWTLVFEYAVPGPGLGAGSTLLAQAGFKYVSLIAEFDSPGLSAEAKFKGISPCIGFRGGMQLSTWLTLEGEVNGFFIKSVNGGVDGTMWDLSVSAQAKFTLLYGAVGYRLLKMDASDTKSNVDTIESKLDIQGIFFEVGVKF
jgi:hypothetical protein